MSDKNNNRENKEIERLYAPVDGIYLVSRTSEGEDIMPCKEAYCAEILDVDRRTVSKPQYLSSYKNKSTDWWYKKGKNHRVENGHICRDIGWSMKWIVKIDNLRDFIEKHGQCIVDINNDNGFSTIEIYDGYRE